MKIHEIIARIIDDIKDPTGRTQRQFLVLKRWASNLFHGTFVACTGFGKTRVGLEAIKLLRRSDVRREVIVVVPTIPLKLQWEKLLREAKQDAFTEVWVINSIASSDTLKYCSLLVCDEIHRYAAETFSEVFKVVKYQYILGLTATIERKDGKHVMLEQKAPIVDTVHLPMARKMGWVAEYEIYNYGIALPEDEQQEYDTLYGKESKLMKYMAVFGYDIKRIINASFSNKPIGGGSYWRDPLNVTIARNWGWSGNNAYRAAMINRANAEAPRGQKVNIWGGDLRHIYHPDKIIGYAVQARRLIAERKKFVQNHWRKTQALIDIYHDQKVKTISFAESKEVAKELQKRIGDKAVSYYSQMDSIPMMVTKTKVYKTEKGAKKFTDKYPETLFDIKVESGKFTISWQQEKFVGEKFQKEEALRKLTDNRYKIDFISSVKSLNEGIDIPDLALALIHSRNSTPRDTIQRIGRVARLFIYKDGSDKKPIIVNIYLKNTKDEDWLRSAMKTTPGSIWIDNISQIGRNEQFSMIA